MGSAQRFCSWQERLPVHTQTLENLPQSTDQCQQVRLKERPKTQQYCLQKERLFDSSSIKLKRKAKKEFHAELLGDLNLSLTLARVLVTDFEVSSTPAWGCTSSYPWSLQIQHSPVHEADSQCLKDEDLASSEQPQLVIIFAQLSPCGYLKMPPVVCLPASPCLVSPSEFQKLLRDLCPLHLPSPTSHCPSVAS